MPSGLSHVEGAAQCSTSPETFMDGEPGSEGPGDSSTGAQQPGRPVPAWLLVAGLQPAGRFAAWGTNPTSCSRPTER